MNPNASKSFKPAPYWDQEEAIAFCTAVEEICPYYGCHVAMTGGVLYKQGPRKDLDLVFYRIRQVPEIQVAELLASLQTRLGVVVVTAGASENAPFVIKLTWRGLRVDCMFPESTYGVYPPP